MSRTKITFRDFLHLLKEQGLAGNQVQIAKLLKVDPAVVSQWKRRDSVPDKYKYYIQNLVRENQGKDTGLKSKKGDSKNMILYENPIDCGDWVLIGYNLRFIKKDGRKEIYDETLKQWVPVEISPPK